LKKLVAIPVTSWNYIGHDPKVNRHYGPMAQDFFAAFGHDGVGTVGSATTINSSDLSGVLMLALQALEKRTAELRSDNETLRAENVRLKTRLDEIETTREEARLKTRIEALELLLGTATLNPGR
jgi:hypothetical protein